jgi:hypothetical protein
MAEPTSALTFYDLILRVAKAAELAYYGVTGQERAMIPIDPEPLDRCKMVVNDAIRGFIAAAPAHGWRWRNREMRVNLVRAYEGTATAGAAGSLTDGGIAGDYADDYFNGYVLRITAGTGLDEYATVTDYVGATGQFLFAALSGGSTPDTTSQYRICRSAQVIDSDPSRYLLTQDFQGEVAGDITFDAGSNACGIEWTSETEIRRNREIDVTTGDAPFTAAIKPNSAKRRWELIVDPWPTSEHTVVFPYKAGFDSLDLVASTATGGGATSLTDTAMIGLYPDDYFNGQVIRIISGTGKTSYAVVTDYAGATGVFTVADWLFAGGTAGGTDPASGSVYCVEPVDNTHPCGMQFDSAIVSACLAKAEEEFADIKRGYLDKYLTSDLPQAHAIDGRSAPRRLNVARGGDGLMKRGGDAVYYTQRGIVRYET